MSYLTAYIYIYIHIHTYANRDRQMDGWIDGWILLQVRLMNVLLGFSVVGAPALHPEPV